MERTKVERHNSVAELIFDIFLQFNFRKMSRI